MAVYTSTSAFLVLLPDPNSKAFPKAQAKSCSLLHLISPNEMELFQVAGSPVIVQILNLKLSLWPLFWISVLFISSCSCIWGSCPLSRWKYLTPDLCLSLILLHTPIRGHCINSYGLGQLHSSSEEKKSGSCWAGLSWVAKPR